MDPEHLIASKSFKYRGVRLNPGDSFTAPRKLAKALKAIKRATYATDVPAHTSEHSTQPDTPPADLSPAVTYETADMEAEPVTTQGVQPKRAYRTRQMRPKS